MRQTEDYEQRYGGKEGGVSLPDLVERLGRTSQSQDYHSCSSPSM